MSKTKHTPEDLQKIAEEQIMFWLQNPEQSPLSFDKLMFEVRVHGALEAVERIEDAIMGDSTSDIIEAPYSAVQAEIEAIRKEAKHIIGLGN